MSQAELQCVIRLSVVDAKFFGAVRALLQLYDIVDLDRKMIREEISVIEGRWIDTVGKELARLDDPAAIEETLARVFGVE